ncbi:flagellar hook-length control protein FliK [Sphingomonas sp. BK345]|uniref:flagellar hook-length control protein FliK n=1 Tax=Sphingomonas sp. BK345 TaxID=2586980 RepID=UPI00160F3289|nr:flagellar hook-length control protein FliK [Sphingomonas sp. BK345]MBB3474598.1 flagellar hook-length control protein FliK [Sphingomonas sp. BK345]
MPVIDVHSAATSGQRAPSFKASREDDGSTTSRFDHLLASEISGEGEAPAARDKATAEMASARAQATPGASGVQSGSDAPRLGSPFATLLVTERAVATVPATVSAADDAIATLSANGDTAVATSTEHAQPAAVHATASNTTIPPHTTTSAATISLGGGPVLGAPVTDGLTLVADEDAPAPASGGGTSVSRRNLAAEGEDTVAADLDGSIADEAGVVDPAGTATAALVSATHAGKVVGSMQPETSVTAGKLVSASPVASAPARACDLIEAADALHEEAGQARGKLGDRTPSFDVSATMPASVGAHRSASSFPFDAPPPDITPAAVGATPLSAAVARSGVAAETDAAALRHVERLYAPHDGRSPSGNAATFARLGTIGQDTGVALARGVADGRDHVAIRLDPPDLGRIDVQLSFGQDGGLRAVVASDNRAALDLLRHDLDQLQRALADAGVRADAQSFHFSERQSGGSQRWDAPVARDQRYAALTDPAAERPSTAPTPRRLRSSGLIDVFA